MTIASPESSSNSSTQAVQQTKIADPPVKNMSPEQQLELLRITGIGLDWAQGRISFDQVKKKLGAPARHVGGYTNAYVYFPDVATVKFIFDDHRLINGSPAVKTFHLLVDPHLKPHIPMEAYEAKLGLHRLMQGEKIDTVPVETRKFFNPGYAQPDDLPNRVILLPPAFAS